MREFYQGHNRQYDIELTFNSDKPLEIVTKKIYGVKKLAQVFLNILLKLLEENIPKSGIDPEYLKILFRDLVSKSVGIIANEFNDETYLDEVIDRVDIVSMEISEGTLIVTLRLYSKAGDYAPVGIGFPVY